MIMILAALAAAVVQTATENPVTTVARLMEEADPITDERSVFATYGERQARLAFGCSKIGDRSTLRVIVRFTNHIGEAEPGLLAGGIGLQFRFDQRPPRTVFWFAHGAEVYAKMPETRPLAFILAMKGSTRVYLRTTDFSGNTQDIAFSYSEPTALIDDVLARCGYSPNGKKLQR